MRFSYSSPDEEATGYVCTLDAVEVSCPGISPAGGSRELTGLADGSHTFAVSAVGRGVRPARDGTPAARTWTVDLGGEPPSSPGLTIARVVSSSRRVSVVAALDPAATGRVRASLTVRVGRGRVTTRAVGRPAAGAVRIRLSLDAAAARAERGLLTLAYAGGDGFAAQTLTRQVRLRVPSQNEQAMGSPARGVWVMDDGVRIMAHRCKRCQAAGAVWSRRPRCPSMFRSQSDPAVGSSGSDRTVDVRLLLMDPGTVAAAVGRLSSSHRAVLHECQSLGLSVAEAASRLGVSEQTVKMWAHDALHALRLHLREAALQR